MTKIAGININKILMRINNMKKILTFAAIILLTACGRSVKVSDLQYEESNRSNIFYVYYEDKPFDGEAWSDDGGSFKIIVECGIMKRLECFDEDGNLFYAFDCNDRAELYYNENGSEITKEQARDLYPNKYKHLNEALLGEIDDIINQRMIESNRNERSDLVEADDDISNEAKEELSAAKLEISQIKKEVDKLFAKLIATKENLEHANESLTKLKSGTDEYKKAQNEKSTLTNEIKEIIDDINSKYAKYYGFLLTATQDTSLYNAACNKVKSTIAVEILNKRKQEALDRINEKYNDY